MHPSFTGATWVSADADPTAIEKLRAAGLSPVAARCAAVRWGVDAERHTAAPCLDHLEDPATMAGMGQAVERLQRAVARGERVRIITDYDVDGTTSSLILQATLAVLGAKDAVDYHIPNRFGEGYGFSVQAADAAAEAGVGLVVTADIGVRDHAAVARARERGMDVLICDHHLPSGADVPQSALVLCPPQAGCAYPNPHLAACGISLKLAQSLLCAHPKRDAIVRSLLKLAAVGTVADMVPLTSPENRAIVALGLAELNRGPHHAGLEALLGAAGLRAGAIAENDLGFRIGPRINAAGRMADAKLVVRLLNCREPAAASQLAGRIEQHNHDRRRVQEQLVTAALEQLEASGLSPFVVLGGPEGEGWHRGVVGIVAARVKDEVHRPVAVLSVQGDLAVGSVRSVPGVHAVHALDAASDLLVKYGGHPAAAGFTVPSPSIEALRERLSAWVEAQETGLAPVREIDAELPAEQLHLGMHDELASLGPFGQGNPKPRLLVRGVGARDVRLLGAAQRMVKFRLPRPGLGDLDAIWWDQARHAEALAGHPIDLLGTLSLNKWRGSTRLQFKVSDARRSRAA